MLSYIPREYMYLDILHVFYAYPYVSQTSPRYILGYTSDTSKYMYLARFLGVTLDTYQDTSGYVSLGLFITIHLMSYIRIHRDTKSLYMYLGRVMTRYVSEMQYTCGIHARYMYLQG
jgi:hypothetical protein